MTSLSPARAAPHQPQEKAAAARRLRLAYLVNQYPQPSHSFIRREIAALEALGHQVERYTLRHGQTPLVEPADQAERARAQAVLEGGLARLVGAVLVRLAARPWRTLRTLLFALRLGWRSDRGAVLHAIYFAEACVVLGWCRRDRVEHLHVHFGTNAATVALLCRHLGGPQYSFTVHGPEEFDKPEFLHLGVKIEHAAFVVAISEFGRSQLFRLVNYDQWSKIQVVRCGLDDAFLLAPPTPPPDAPRLVCVARLHEQKGLPLLIEAVANLGDEREQVELVIIGDGPLRPQLEALLAARGLTRQVSLAGWQSAAAVRAALRDARALVLPSFAEGLPVVIMESLALHRPVVSTYVAGIVELVEPGRCGWLVPAGACAPLAAALREVLAASPETLSRMGAAGAQRVAKRHSAAHEAARLAELFAAAQR